jgi:signal transduction histidine kinase
VHEEISAAFDQLLSSKGAIERAAIALESTALDFEIGRSSEPSDPTTLRIERALEAELIAASAPPPAFLDDVHEIALAMFESSTGLLRAANGRYLELVDRVCHVPRAQCLGKRFDEVFVGRPADEASTIFRRVLELNAAARFSEVHLEGPDIDLVWDVTVSPAHPYVMVSMVDVTQHVKAKESAARATDAKQRFLLAASRELKAPLIPLSGYAELLASIIEDYPRPADLDARLPAITGKFTKQVKQLARLIDDIADVSHAEAGKLTVERRWTSLPDLLRRAVKEAKARWSALEVTLAIDVGAEKCSVFGDDARLLQVIANLLDNAFRYATASKVVEIELRVLDEGTGRPCEIAVRDRGPGIDPEVQRGLFRELYFTRPESSRRRMGLGLGLYIARAIVELHEGTIRVESEVGKGSTFFIRLPNRR